MNANWGEPGEGLSFPGLFQPQQQQGQPMFSFPQQGAPPLYNSAGQPSWDQQLHQHATFPSGGDAAFQPQGGVYQQQQSFQHVLGDGEGHTRIYDTLDCVFIYIRIYVSAR